MARQFIKADYEATLKQIVTLKECLPADHLARFIVGIVALLDLSAIYAGYAAVGGAAFAPELLLGLLFYGYATGVCSSRKLELAAYESLPCCFIGGGLHPDRDTIAHFRKTLLAQISELFVQVLGVAAELGVLQVGRINVSFDGSKVHTDASKSHAVSHGRLRKLDIQLRREVAELLALAEQADQAPLPARSVCGSSTWPIWRKPSRFWRLAPRSAMRPSKPNVKPSCRHARPKARRVGPAAWPRAPAADPRSPAGRPIQLH